MNRLTADEASAGVAQLDGWKVKDDTIMRRIKTRDFADALRIANLAGEVAEQRNHHPEIRLGWGFCRITFTTHDAGGLTQADLDAAAALDAALAGG